MLHKKFIGSPWKYCNLIRVVRERTPYSRTRFDPWLIRDQIPSIYVIEYCSHKHFLISRRTSDRASEGRRISHVVALANCDIPDQKLVSWLCHCCSKGEVHAKETRNVLFKFSHRIRPDPETDAYHILLLVHSPRSLMWTHKSVHTIKAPSWIPLVPAITRRLTSYSLMATEPNLAIVREASIRLCGTESD